MGIISGVNLADVDILDVMFLLYFFHTRSVRQEKASMLDIATSLTFVAKLVHVFTA